MKKRLVTLLGLPLLLLGAVLLVMPTQIAQADFNANNVADDYTFDNVGTMNANQIDTFLNTFPSSCISWNNGFTAPDPTGYSPSGGYTYGGFVTAGQVIFDASQAYGLNPQVLIATLQKEESLVTGSAGCATWQYTSAVGYGCPDGGTSYSYSGINLYAIHGTPVTSINGTCVNSAAKAGFSQQIIHAAWLFKFGEERSEGNTGWAVIKGGWNNSDDPATCYSGPMTQGNHQQCSGGPTVYYDGYTTIDGSSTHMDTGATAALYWYTPHFSGNQHFDTIFQSWFGPTVGQGFEKVISDDPNDLRQWVVDGNIKQYIPDSQTLTAWNLLNVPLNTMPAAQLAAIPTGPTFTRLTRVNGDPNTVYFIDNGTRYTVPWPSMLTTWNLNNLPIDSVTAGLINQTGSGGYLTNSIKDPGSTTFYMMDGANGSGQTIIRPYQNGTTFNAWEGDTTPYISVSSDYFNTIKSAVGSTLVGTEISYNGSNYQVVNGSYLSEPSSYSALFPGSPNAVSTATFNRLVPGGALSPFIRAAGDPRVYLVDSGTKHAVASTSVLNAWLPSGYGINIVDTSFENLITTGAALNGYTADNGSQLYLMNSNKIPVPTGLTTAYRAALPPLSVSTAFTNLVPLSNTSLTGFIKGASSPQVYMLDNTGQKRWIEYPDKAALFGATGGNVLSYIDDAVNSIPTAASPQTYVSDGTTNYMIESGVKHPISGSTITDWGASNPQVYSDGTLSRFTTGAAMASKLQSGSNYYLVKEGRAFLTVDINIANTWGIDNAPQMDSRLISSRMAVYMLTRFVKSTTDNRIFAVDQGNWYNLSAAQLANLGGTGAPTTGLSPSSAPNSITDWTNVVVQDHNGKYYVIDGGAKRGFANSIIQNAWSGNGTLSVPTTSNGFLNLLPTGVNMERAIKGSGPSVYSAEAGVKRHILYPNTYQTGYAPFTTVSDSLLNAMPTGTDIN